MGEGYLFDGDVLSDEKLSYIATASATLLAGFGLSQREISDVIKSATSRRLHILQFGWLAHAELGVTNCSATSGKRRLRRILKRCDELLARAWLTVQGSDFDLVESSLKDAVNAVQQPSLLWLYLVALARCYAIRANAQADFMARELSILATRRAAGFLRSLQVEKTFDERLALIEALLMQAWGSVEIAEMIPGLNDRHLSSAKTSLLAARGVLKEWPEIRGVRRIGLLPPRRYLRFDRNCLMLESRAAVLEYVSDHDVNHIRDAISRAQLACNLSRLSKDAEDIAASELLLARQLISFLPLSDDEERETLRKQAMNSLAQAVAAAVLGGPTHLEALELGAVVLDASGDEWSREIANMVRSSCLKGTLPAASQVRLRIASSWAEDGAGHGEWTLAASRYDIALAALDYLTSAHPFEAHKEAWLVHTASLRSEAAHAHAMAGEYLRAVEISDAGRLKMLSSNNTDWLPELKPLAEQGHGDLADAFQDADLRYAQAAEQANFRLFDVPSTEELEDDLRRLTSASRSRREALNAIRELPGFKDFPRPLDGAAITECAVDGPLLYLVSGSTGGSLLMIDAERPPKWRELPALRLSEVNKRAHRYRQMYAAHLDASDEDAEAAMRAWADEIEEVTEWLWSAAAEQMLEVLDGRPFARLIAMGPIGLLPPIHAACTPGSDPKARTYVHEAVALSYLPSAAALRRRERLSPSGPTDWRPLIVSDPAWQTAEPLTWSSLEISSLCERLPSADQLTGEAATRDGLRDALPRHNLLHLSAHGNYDDDQPRRSGFGLAGGERVTVGDLRAWDTSSLQLLVLSSCDSAMASGSMPDEMISLPGAIFASSGCQVIGTMWEVEQEIAALFFNAFYRNWNLSARAPDVAEAVRCAMLDIRMEADSEGYPLTHPARWAPFALVA